MYLLVAIKCRLLNDRPSLFLVTVQSPTATICTASLTFSNSTFCPHILFMCCLWIWEQTAIISLYNINWLVFITETECVYCVVRTGSLCIVQVELKSWMAEAVSRRRLTAEAQVRSQASTHEICGGHSGTGTHFSPSTSCFPLSVSFHQRSILIVIYMILSREGRTGEVWESSYSNGFPEIGECWTETYSRPDVYRVGWTERFPIQEAKGGHIYLPHCCAEIPVFWGAARLMKTWSAPASRTDSYSVSVSSYHSVVQSPQQRATPICLCV